METPDYQNMESAELEVRQAKAVNWLTSHKKKDENFWEIWKRLKLITRVLASRNLTLEASKTKNLINWAREFTQQDAEISKVRQNLF